MTQFLERLPKMSGSTPTFPDAPRYLGLALIGAGILALLVSAHQYRQLLAYLWARDFESIAGMKQSPIQTPLYLITIAMILIGLFAFGAVLLRAV